MGRIDNKRHDTLSLLLLLLSEAAILALILVSCRSVKYVPVESVHDVYHNTTDTVRDSIYHDIFVNQYIKGDTVFRDKTEYLYRDKWRNRTDTLVKTDSVQVPYPIEKQLTKWQQLKQDWFGTLICVLLTFLATLIILVTYIVKTRLKQNS